ncbi:copper resistance CopC family protein [Pseudarthrobacter sp. J1738]|uniref:copper resistance CopC family protein n=1 Tax=unclassified Pseudarthrobacter TaxID=2647000 RepID=UPI003D27AC24
MSARRLPFLPSSRVVMRWLGALLLVAGLGSLGVAAASAHDSVVGTSPSKDSTVAVVPSQVTVTYSENPQGINPIVQVKDASGTNWSDGAPTIVDNVVTQKLKAGAPAGKYTVLADIVSSDAHRTQENFTFTAKAGSPAADGSGTTAATAPSGDGAVAGTAAPGSPGPETATDDASEPFPWSIVAFALVAVGLLVALALMARRRIGADSTGSAANASDDELDDDDDDDFDQEDGVTQDRIV